MSRFIVERAFPGGVLLPMTDAGANACARIVGGCAEGGVTWIHSYVSADKKGRIAFTTRRRLRRSGMSHAVTTFRSIASPK